MINDHRLSRRTLLGLIGGGALSSTLADAAPESGAVVGARLPGWQPGMLDIHHISTGRGNCALFILPDGTTAMVDAGDMRGEPQYLIDIKPDNTRRPGEWMGRYAKRHLAAAGRRELDYFVLTHLHEDHMGWVLPSSPIGPGGAYRLTGISDVAQVVPIRRYIDRDFPTYTYPEPQSRESPLNYIAFIRDEHARGKMIERFRSGSHRQIALLRAPKKYQNCIIQNIVSNGEVWTGHGEETKQLFPSLAALVRTDYPTENMCSLAFRLSYGAFDYYTGGDLTNFDNYGAEAWRDIETPVAQVAGPVEVAVVNHHGYADAAGPGFVRALRPQQFIIEAWDSAHPVVSTLANMQSQQLYPDKREIFATALKPENVIANKQLRTISSANGHVIVRVAAGGESYNVFVTTNADESDTLISCHGPYHSTARRSARAETP